MTRRKAIKLALAALAGAAVPAAVAGEMTTLAGVAGLGRPYVIGSRLAIAQAIRVQLQHPGVNGGAWFDAKSLTSRVGHVQVRLPSDTRTYQVSIQFAAESF